MKLDLQLFKNTEFGELNILVKDGKELFPATDCARILGYSNPYDAISRHCKGCVKHEGVSFTTNQYGAITEQITEINYISEGDLYRLIVRSNLPSADKFERWIFDEVLPSIRKHGAYMTPAIIEEALVNPDILIRLATILKEEQEKNKALTAKIEEDKEFTKFAKEISISSKSVDTDEYSKICCNSGIKIGRVKLYKWFRENGYVLKNSCIPAQKYINDGLFQLEEKTRRGKQGEIIPYFKTSITGKGQIYFLDKLKSSLCTE